VRFFSVFELKILEKKIFEGMMMYQVSVKAKKKKAP
jgi:hypothetical protein